MDVGEAPLLSLLNEKKAPLTGFVLIVTDLANMTDPVHPVHPRELGGIDKICEGLHVDPTIGLCSNDADENSTDKTTSGIKFAARGNAFGNNTLVIEGHKMIVLHLTLFVLVIYLISGTTVLSGSGSLLVTAVGCNLLENKTGDSEQ